MKVLVLFITLTIFTYTCALQLTPTENIDELFVKYGQNNLSAIDKEVFDNMLELLRRPKPIQSIKSLRHESTSRAVLDCIICRAASFTVISLVKRNISESTINGIMTTMCVLLGIQSYDVCHGIISLNLPILIYIIKTTPEYNSKLFCALMLQTADDKIGSCGYEDKRFDWKVDLPLPLVPDNPPDPDTKPLKIGFISDIHIDPLYTVHGVANCLEPTCCRTGQKVEKNIKQPNTELEESVISHGILDSAGVKSLSSAIGGLLRKVRKLVTARTPVEGTTSENVPMPPGIWGDYRNCDTPYWTFDELLKRMVESNPDLDLVYYTGDTINHFIWETSKEEDSKLHQHVIDRLYDTFGNKTKVIPSIGNHEISPINQFAPSYITDEKLNSTWLYNSLADKWSHSLTEDALYTLRRQGDYSMLVRPGLRVISLNNNVAYRLNWWVAYDPLDAKIHLDWLIQELFKAETASEKVHILSHIPPGSEDLFKTWSREYNRIVNRFTKTIAAEFNGHTHVDEFVLFYNPDGEPINVAWNAGGVTTYSFYNVNYKIVEIDPATYTPSNIKNYVFNLTEANLSPQRPRWFELYDMKKTYGIPDLSANSINNLVYRMVTTNRTLLDTFSDFYTKDSDYKGDPCNTECKLDRLCEIVVSELWERRVCNELKTLFYNELP